MGCCSSKKFSIQKGQRPIYKQESLKAENSQMFNLSQEKCLDQQQEQETSGKPNLKTKKINKLISLKYQEEIIQNKDNLNAVDDEFFSSQNQHNLYRIEKRNSDSDY
ncbi:unnamed protein product [Paramecium sonneborni]|uniref:Uncharacterized protein n=1 Tax=Paramecium sonneborni TaxID=65129 RepID=A0A8S1LHF9_9CILI|nr:unnamed protein product [Paramecium sonneborni]